MTEDVTPPTKEPMFNIPPLTLIVGIILAIMFAALQKPAWQDLLVPLLAFVPNEWSMATYYTALSYALLHFGWPHIAVNLAGLLAFGSGVERHFGKRLFLLIFLLGCIAGAVGHWALFPQSSTALGGASAGISALFGAVLPLLMKRKELLIANIVFIVTNLALGQIGLPTQEDVVIAWQAHIFGFVTGEIISILILRFFWKQDA